MLGCGFFSVFRLDGLALEEDQVRQQGLDEGVPIWVLTQRVASNAQGSGFKSRVGNRLIMTKQRINPRPMDPLTRQ